MGNESVWIWMNHVIWWVIKLVVKAALNKKRKWRNTRIWNPHFKNLCDIFWLNKIRWLHFSWKLCVICQKWLSFLRNLFGCTQRLSNSTHCLSVMHWLRMRHLWIFRCYFFHTFRLCAVIICWTPRTSPGCTCNFRQQ